MISFEDLRKKQQSGAINSLVISLLRRGDSPWRSLLNNNSDEEARKHYETLKGFKAFIEGGRDEARSNYNKVKAELFPDQQQFDIFATFI